MREKLRHAARRRIEQVGIRATAVGDLTRQAGVSKGAFYLLYHSKEDLVKEVFAEVESEVRRELDALVEQPGSAEERLRAIIRFFFEIVGAHPLLRLLADPTEGPQLWRTVPAEEMEELLADDDRYFMEVADRLKETGALDPEASSYLVAAVPRLALAVTQARDLIGDDRHAAMVNLVVDGLTTELQARSTA